MSSQMKTFSTMDDSTAFFPLPYRGHFSAHREDIFSEDEFPLAVIWLTDHPDLGLHTHDFTELVLVLGGSARHMTEEGEYLIHPGDVFVIPPGVAHGYTECGRLELVNIVITKQTRLNLPNTSLMGFPGYRALFTLEPAFRSRHEFKGRLHLPPHKCREVTQLVSDLQEELWHHKDGFHFICLTLLMQIIGQLFAHLHGDGYVHFPLVPPPGTGAPAHRDPLRGRLKTGGLGQDSRHVQSNATALFFRKSFAMSPNPFPQPAARRQCLQGTSPEQFHDHRSR